MEEALLAMDSICTKLSLSLGTSLSAPGDLQMEHSNRSLLALNLILSLLLVTSAPRPAMAFSLKKRMIQIAVCGGAAYGGLKLGEKIVEMEAIKRKLSGADAEKYRKAILIGTAAALCAGGFYLTGTVYENLSKKDREARDKEMALALADANPGTRHYVLPESQMTGTLTTEAPQAEDGKQCRWQIDTLSANGEPVRAKHCRKSEKDKYELAIF